MDSVGFLGGILAHRRDVMAIGAQWPYRYILPARVCVAVSMELDRAMTIGTGHSLAVMYVCRTAVLAVEFRPYATTVAQGTGFFIVLLHETVTVQQSGTDAGNRGALDVAIAARCVAAAARLFKYLGIEQFLASGIHPAHRAVLHSGSGVMEREGIRFGGSLVTFTA